MNRIKSLILKVISITTVAFSFIAAGSFQLHNDQRLNAQETISNNESTCLARPSELSRTGVDYPFPSIAHRDDNPFPQECYDVGVCLYFDGAHLYESVFWFYDSATTPDLTYCNEITPASLGNSFSINAANKSISFGSNFCERICSSEYLPTVLVQNHFTSLFIDCGSLGETATISFESGFSNAGYPFLGSAGISIYAPRCDLKIDAARKANVYIIGGLGGIFAQSLEISGDGFVSILSSQQVRWGGMEFNLCYPILFAENAGGITFSDVIEAFAFPASALCALNNLVIKNNAFVSVFWDPYFDENIFGGTDARNLYLKSTSSIFSPTIDIEDTSRVFVGFYSHELDYTKEYHPFEVSAKASPNWNFRGYCVDQAYSQSSYYALSYLPSVGQNRFNQATIPTSPDESGFYSLNCNFGTGDSGDRHLLYLVSGDSDVHLLHIELGTGTGVTDLLDTSIFLSYYIDNRLNVIRRYFPSLPIPVVNGVPYALSFPVADPENGYYYYEGCYFDSAMNNKVDDEIILDGLCGADITLYAKYSEPEPDLGMMLSKLYWGSEVSGECSANFADALHFAKYSMSPQGRLKLSNNYSGAYLRFQNWAKANDCTVTIDEDGFLIVGAYLPGEDNNGLVSASTSFNTTSSLPVILISSIAVTCSAFVIVVLSNKRRKKKENTK